MFDFNDNEEEAERKNWYGPIGEFVVLFSNLEFSTQEWVRLLTNSADIRNHVMSVLILPSTDGQPVKRVNYATEVNHGKTDNPQENIPHTLL